MNYNEKKHGFEVTKHDREQKEQAAKRERLEAKIDKLDLAKIETEYESLLRATYLAPHQHERKHFLQKAISVLKKKKAELAEAPSPSPDTLAVQTSTVAQNSSRKRRRSVSGSSNSDDNSSCDENDDNGVSAAAPSIADDRWAAVIATSVSTKKSADTVFAPATRGSSVTFVPRVVNRKNATSHQVTPSHTSAVEKDVLGGSAEVHPSNVLDEEVLDFLHGF
mmetsp:Transcript_30121/g.34841  ORF Transcript_30121/g.34841 Transcript_30121/m.34841 type:complete len:222 (+) Transcript_30121:28-693(+)